MSEYVRAAAAIGHRIGNHDAAAILEAPGGRDPLPPDDTHYAGADIGRLMCDAYDEGGARDAIDVLLAYLEQYNAARSSADLPLITDEVMRDCLGWSARFRATDAQIADMREEFITRRGISHRQCCRDYEDQGQPEPDHARQSL